MDKYEKVRKIGEGSFGKAILVKSREDGKQYVIKEIGISRMSSKERQESRKEVAVLANMSHPNIVQYKESFEECGCLYIVMDYCEGGDLFKTINSQKGVQFPEEQILDWLVQICLALKHVHDRKILHRDIKSQNIFLTKDGTIQLGDFGIARVLNSTVELARTCIGTPYYLSPEICENKPYNNKSDVWALGCVLYEMCTLKHAFEAGNMKNLVLKIIRGSYPPVSIHYSQDLRSLMGQLFRRNPRERPSVSSILDKPFLSHRIFRFLTPEIIAQEFSHSFLHKQPKAGVAQAASAKRRAPAPMPVTPAQKITKPAAKYGVPLNVRKASDAAMKPAEWKPAVKHKMVSTGREPVASFSLLNRMILYWLCIINRINRAREQGWRHVLSSSGGSSPERKVQNDPPPPNHHLLWFHFISLTTLEMFYHQSKLLLSNSQSYLSPVFCRRQRGHAAAERANQVQEFLQRKRDAMLNKVRAEGQLEYLSRLRQIRLQNFNERQQIKARLRGVKYDSDGSDSKESCEETELRRKKIEALKAQAQARAAVLKEQLEKKRREAYEREKRAWEDHLAARGVKVGMVAGGVAVELAPPPRPGPSLPVQDVVARAQPASKPSTPVISMTSALKDVGAVSKHLKLSQLFSSIIPFLLHMLSFSHLSVSQHEKKEILRRLNQNLKAQSPEEEVSATPSEELCPTPQQSQPIAEERPSSGGDRKKWEAVAPSILSVAQQTLEETCIRTTGELYHLSPRAGLLNRIVFAIERTRTCLNCWIDKNPWIPTLTILILSIAPVYEEPLFVKLCSSPAHRRTAALVLMSAQSSMEDSSSSLASRSRSVSPLRSKHHNALLIGLSTGQFDANNPKNTKKPNFTSLFCGTSFVQFENMTCYEYYELCSLSVYEDDDLRELRASMERLLQEERSEEDEGGSGSNSGSPPEEEGGDGFNGNPAEDEDDEELNGMAVDEEEEEHHSSESHGEEEDGAAEQQDSIFSRLEELRFNLEQEMGFENFIEAYNKIKAIHEDEDENIDMGPDMVLNILGTEHQHLYPNILHLVMADGAYQEG
uniref:non-specific serine/threonine protein kinase n=1 Tax=Oncorhynchus kisutch TaxID=8019 RepID=A0A8C7E1H5_ONCKI